MNARNDEREIEAMHECDECEGEGCHVCHDEGVVEAEDGLLYGCQECTKPREIPQYP